MSGDWRRLHRVHGVSSCSPENHWVPWLIHKAKTEEPKTVLQQLQTGLTGVLFIPSCPGYTSLTGALDRSYRCKSLVGFASGELLDSCVFGSWCCWSVLGLFGVVLLGFV
jgi:hypothetical protein